MTVGAIIAYAVKPINSQCLAGLFLLMNRGNRTVKYSVYQVL